MARNTQPNFPKIARYFFHFLIIISTTIIGLTTWSHEQLPLDNCVRLLGADQQADSTLQRLLSSYKPFNFRAHPITIGEEIEAYVPEDFGKFSKKYQRDTEQMISNNVQPYKYARSALAEYSAQALKELLNVGYRRHVVFVEDERAISFIKYRTVPQQSLLQIITLSHDYTIRMNKNFVGVEISSPIMSHPRDFQIYDDMVDRIQQAANLVARPEMDTGLHVHVGIPGARVHELLVMLLTFSKIEEQLRERFDIHWHRQAYAQELPIDEIKEYIKRQEKFSRSFDIEELSDLLATRDRAFNILALKKHGTVEFRLFDSTFDRDLRNKYRHFAKRFVQSIRSKEPAMVELLLKYENSDEIPLNEFMVTLGSY
jgi:hypothetical protein